MTLIWLVSIWLLTLTWFALTARRPQVSHPSPPVESEQESRAA